MAASNFKDITGYKFGRLQVLNFAGIHEYERVAMWRVKCDCGVEFVVRGTHLRSGPRGVADVFEAKKLPREILCLKRSIRNGYYGVAYRRLCGQSLWRDQENRCSFVRWSSSAGAPGEWGHGCVSH